MLDTEAFLGKRVAEVLKKHGITAIPIEEIESLDARDERAIALRTERLKMELEIKAFDRIMEEDLIDREYLKPCRKWNDAPAWTPGGGAPRRRGRRRP